MSYTITQGKGSQARIYEGLTADEAIAKAEVMLVDGRKEVAISVLNGLMWGFLMGVVTLLLYGSLPLAGVMALAMFLNMLVAAIAGVLCPLVLERMGRDPVMGSSILLTAITDSMGFLIFLGLATALLL